MNIKIRAILESNLNYYFLKTKYLWLMFCDYSIIIVYCSTVEPEYASTASMFGAASIVTGIFAGIGLSYAMPVLVCHHHISLAPCWVYVGRQEYVSYAMPVAGNATSSIGSSNLSQWSQEAFIVMDTATEERLMSVACTIPLLVSQTTYYCHLLYHMVCGKTCKPVVPCQWLWMPQLPTYRLQIRGQHLWKPPHI